VKFNEPMTSIWTLSLVVALSLLITINCNLMENDHDISGMDTTNLKLGETIILAEVAFTPEEKSKGLSGRKSLNNGSGMLFYYLESSPSGFWMKGMLFAIDIIWIGKDCRIIKIDAGIPPPSSLNQLEIYPAPELTGAVLELNSGQASSLGLKIGDLVFYETTKMGKTLFCTE